MNKLVQLIVDAHKLLEALLLGQPADDVLLIELGCAGDAAAVKRFHPCSVAERCISHEVPVRLHGKARLEEDLVVHIVSVD